MKATSIRLTCTYEGRDNLIASLEGIPWSTLPPPLAQLLAVIGAPENWSEREVDE